MRGWARLEDRFAGGVGGGGGVDAEVFGFVGDDDLSILQKQIRRRTIEPIYLSVRS